MSHSPHVIVVGAGVMGASAAYHLACAGMSVTVIERHATAGAGVTAQSFGWVGTGAMRPADDPAGFALRQRGIAAYADLARQLGPLPVAVRGALVWYGDEDVTASFIAEQQAAGVRAEPVGPTWLAEHEPALATRPGLASRLPDDLAVEPAAFAQLLLASAVGMGAQIACGSVESIELENGRATGVRADGVSMRADAVVLANGFDARELAASAGIALSLHASPAVLVHFAGTPPIRHLLAGSGLEVRPGPEGDLVAAADYPAEGEEGLRAVAEQVGTGLAALLGLPRAPELMSVAAAWRPMTRGGVPLAEFTPEIAGLYPLVAHPGVMLAPLLGKHAAASIAASI